MRIIEKKLSNGRAEKGCVIKECGNNIVYMPIFYCEDRPYTKINKKWLGGFKYKPKISRSNHKIIN